MLGGHTAGSPIRIAPSDQFAAGDVWVADQDGDRVLRLTDVGVVPR